MRSVSRCHEKCLRCTRNRPGKLHTVTTFSTSDSLTMRKCWFVGWDKVDVYLFHVDVVDGDDVIVVLLAVFLCAHVRECLLCTKSDFVRCFC